jgi:hypothetical protein
MVEEGLKPTTARSLSRRQGRRGRAGSPAGPEARGQSVPAEIKRANWMGCCASPDDNRQARLKPHPAWKSRPEEPPWPASLDNMNIWGIPQPSWVGDATASLLPFAGPTRTTMEGAGCGESARAKPRRDPLADFGPFIVSGRSGPRRLRFGASPPASLA